jgi:septal ring-binding cell division protein DamX
MAEAFPTSGNIDPTTFPFLLMDLHRRGATGSLKVEGPSHPKALYFRGGRILFGSSNDPKDQLGSILIEQSKITQEQLEDVNAKVGPGNPLAKVLAESGYVNQRELGEAARIKVERILSDVIAYGSGSFEFEDGVLPKGAVDLKLSTERLVLGSVARISDRAFVLRHIDGLGVVLAPTAEAQERIGEVRADVTPLLERLDGRRTLKEAVGLTRLDEFEAAKVACGLLFLGVVKRAEPGGTGAPAPEEFDLAAAAQEAFGGDEVEVDQPALSAPAAAAAAFTPDIPFFVPDSEPFPAVTAAVEAEVAPMAEVSGFAADDDTPAFAPVAGGDVMSPPAFARQQETDPILHQDPMAMAPPPAGQGSAPFGFAAAEPAPSLGAPQMFDAPPSFDIPKLDLSSAPAEAVPVEEAFDMDTLPRGIPTSSAAIPSFQMDGPSSGAHHEDEDGPMTAPAARPSKEDLAALDALLNPSSSSVGRVQPAARPDRDRWEPQFRPPAGRRPAARKRSVPIMPLALGVAGFAVAAGAGYYFLVLRPAQAAEVAHSTPATQPPPSIAAPVEGAPSPEAAGPSTAPPVAGTLAPVTVATPGSIKTPPTTTPRVSAPPAASGGDARGLLRAGGYSDAARAFAGELQKGARGKHTIQLLVACSEETVQKAVSAVPADDLFILPVNYKGRSCYRLCWGVYRSEPEAAAAGGTLPDYFRRGGATPKVSSLADLLP